MKVKLNVLERVTIMNMLPQKGNISTCRASQITAKTLMITDEEQKAFEVTVEGATTRWNEAGKVEKEFTLHPSSVKVIRDLLCALDEKEQLPVSALSIYDKFFTEVGVPTTPPT